jgi:hypothetical protein
MEQLKRMDERYKEKLKTELQGSLYRYTLRNKGQRETVEFLLELAVNGPVPETVEKDYATNVICNGRVWLYNHNYPYTIHQGSGRIFLDTREPRKAG